MERVLSLKLLSRISGKTISIPSKTFAFLSQQPTTACHQHHGFFSKYSTWSSGQQNRVFSDKIPYGFFTNPVFANRLFQNTNLKGQSKDLFGSTVGFFRYQISRRYLSNFSFESNRRGWQSWFQRLTPDGVVLGLVLTNVGVFLLWRIASHDFMSKNFTISVDNFKSGRIHTLLTSAFSHHDSGHIISNMVGLYFFGTSMGRVFGPQYVLKLYLAGALAGSVFYLVHHAYMGLSLKGTRVFGIDPSKVPALGASGAVNAIMLLDIFLFPKKTLYLDFIIPVPAILLGIFLVGKDVLRMLEGDSRISGSAHLGGATVAALAWLQIRKGLFRF